MDHKNFQQMEIPVIKMLYDLYKHTGKMIAKFPKHQRYTMGEKIENNILEAIELIIAGNSQPKNFKDAYLIKANSKIEILKLLYRLAFETGSSTDKDYLKSEEYLQEIGKMLGGWIKYIKSN